MSDRMTQIPFEGLINWILTERRESNQVFGIRKPYVKKDGKTLPIFNETLETPFGPAAGPHTQLAQNIVAAYYAGSRFFELKTVQVLDGEDLPVSKPCILADDEGYNCEWSTELYVPQAYEEYVKAWFALKMIAKEFDLGDPDGFVFNMSVGYDLAGIQTEKIDRFIEGLKNAENTPIWKECQEVLLQNLERFEKIDEAYVKGINPHICTSGTLSTLHGCPPQEIERIASYLLTEKKINTYIKCNPTLLGYDTARQIMDEMGYDYVVFGDFHFKDDLQFEDAVPMIESLLKIAADNDLEFGVKITNTFPVDVTRKELPSEEMYMSGRSLFALSMNVAKKLTDAFEGKLRISYSGGADYYNIDRIFQAGIWPITLATTLLKPGGYQRLSQIAELLSQKEYKAFSGVDKEQVATLCQEVLRDPHHTKSVKPLPNRKLEKPVSLLNCFTAPCSQGCPIHQDIPAYVKLVGEGKYQEALSVILDKNPLPFITGTICSHRCMNHCTRNFYEESVQIRSTKLMAAENGLDGLLKELVQELPENQKKVAIIGGGPAGMAAAFFLARGGAAATIFEKRDALGGVVRHIIPEFRIANDAIEKDASLLEQLGVEIRLNSEVQSLEVLKKQGFTHVILATGASKPGTVSLEQGESLNGLAFLESCKKEMDKVRIGKNVAVIGGGNTAMDVARAAKRVPDVENVYLVYRRDKRNMPADEEELELAIEDGVEFKELLAPVSLENGKLICDVMELSTPDASGRRSPKATGARTEILADTVIAAVGEKVDSTVYQKNGLQMDEKGCVAVDKETLESNVSGVFVVGDGLNGPATVVEAIRDASLAVNRILESTERGGIQIPTDISAAEAKKGILAHSHEMKEKERCLECNHMCECCVDVCPNRANLSIKVEGMEMPQIIHVDRMCNECGNCKSFCPYSSAPYKDKFTMFHTVEDFHDSKNAGFVLEDQNTLTFKVRLGNNVETCILSKDDCSLEKELKNLILAVYNNYGYIF